MINYETILSLFDDKLTLLEYLTKIEQALQNEKLTNITVTQTDASHVYFTFVFEDGSTIDTPTFTLPAGPQGIQGPAGADGQDGADGVSVVDADIDASGHLILTLSNGNTIDAGATGLQTVTANDIDSGETTQYEVLKADGDGGATWGRVTAGDIADNEQVGQYLGSTGYGFAGWKKFEVSSGQVNSSGGTQGQVLTADGSGGASWETISGGTTLNKYTYSGASVTISKLRNIIENAKGRIVGMIRTRAMDTNTGITETMVFLPANCIYTSGTIIKFQHEQIMTLNGTNRKYNVCCNMEIAANNALTLNLYAYDYTNSTMVDCSPSAYLNYINITYWNDTQLH